MVSLEHGMFGKFGFYYNFIALWLSTINGVGFGLTIV
jgi:hypothetical protein